ncbi:MAG: SRPBCC family protein [Vicinamibacterales bacterium]
MESTEYERNSSSGAESLAMGLGWFSIGLGLAEITAPHSVARLMGLAEDTPTTNTLRALGVREVANGVAILARPDSAPRVWARVGGDAIDLAVLGRSLGEGNVDRTRLLSSMAAIAGVTLVDIMAAQQLGATGRTGAPRTWRSRDVRVEKVLTINRPIQEVYQFWRRFENLPRFMRHLESVEILSSTRSRWRARAPAGTTVEWEAEILQDRDQEWIAWRSIEGSDVQNSGSVRFKPAPGGRGTEVRVQLQYTPPAGALGRTIAKLFGEEPEQQIANDLRRFKQLLETGEISVSDGPSLRRAAQPPRDPDRLKALAGVPS